MIPLTRDVTIYSLPLGAYGFVFLLGSLSMDLALDLSYQAGLVSSYIFLYVNAPFLFQTVLLCSVALAFVPVILRIFVNKMARWDYVTVGVGVLCYLISIFLIFPSGFTIQELVLHDLQDGEGKVLHLSLYQKDPEVQEALRTFRLGHASLCILCLIGTVAQTLASRLGTVEMRKYD